MEIAEQLLGPQVDPPFARIAMRELDYGDGLRPEEQ